MVKRTKKSLGRSKERSSEGGKEIVAKVNRALSFARHPRAVFSLIFTAFRNGAVAGDPRSRGIVSRLTFPMDAYWHDALWFLLRHRLTALECVGPIEFKKYMPALVLPSFTFFSSPNKYEVVILHKGNRDFFSNGFLKALSDHYTYVYGNEVFNIFVSEKRKLGRKGPPKHAFSHENEPVGDKSAKTICLISAAGFGNLGDDAITFAAETLLKKHFPGWRVARARPPVRKEEVRRASLVVLGGGGLFYDSCFYNLQNYTTPLFWAEENQVPFFCVGIGLQGIKTDIGRTVYGHALRKCEFMCLRDIRDKEILDRIVKSPQKSIAAMDLAFLLGNGNGRFISNPPGPPHSSKKKLNIFMAVLDSNTLLSSARLGTYRSTVLELPEKLAPHRISLVVQSKDDLCLYEEIGERVKRAGGELGLFSFAEDDIDRAVNTYAMADLVIASRFHGFVFSCLNRKPTIATGTLNGKIHRLISNYIPEMKPCFIPIAAFTTSAVMEKIEAIRRDPVSRAIPEHRLAECKKLAKLTDSAIGAYATSIRSFF